MPPALSGPAEAYLSGPIYLFTARNIPIFADPWYFLLVAYMIAVGSDLRSGLVWAICVTVSILVHELGHGLVARWYALEPAIVLHGWGGFTVHEPAKRDGHDALIVIAGPSAGLLFGGIVLAAIWIAEQAQPGFVVARPVLEKFVDNLLFINLFWSLVNLVPLFPLDGGLLLRLGLHKVLRPYTAERVTHGLGLGLAIAWAAVGSLVFDSAFLVILGLLFAWENYQILAGHKAAPAARSAAPAPTGLLAEARQAFEAGDLREAARLCHQIRSERRSDPDELAGAYELLVLATVGLGQHEQALSFSRHAPPTAPVVAARLTALVSLGRTEEARALLDSDESKPLDAATRQRIAQKLSAWSGARSG